jgi:hypothetical protein
MQEAGDAVLAHASVIVVDKALSTGGYAAVAVSRRAHQV